MNLDEIATEDVPDTETLPKVITNSIANNPEDFYKMAFEFQQIMMVLHYYNAIYVANFLS